MPEPTLESLLQAMARHSEANPGHGYNCACKDVQLRAIRIYFSKRRDLLQEAFYVFDVLRRSPYT